MSRAAGPRARRNGLSSRLQHNMQAPPAPIQQSTSLYSYMTVLRANGLRAPLWHSPQYAVLGVSSVSRRSASPKSCRAASRRRCGRRAPVGAQSRASSASPLPASSARSERQQIAYGHPSAPRRPLGHHDRQLRPKLVEDLAADPQATRRCWTRPPPPENPARLADALDRRRPLAADRRAIVAFSTCSGEDRADVVRIAAPTG